MTAAQTQVLEMPDVVVRAVLNQSPVDEPPHNFYKYPARFSPVFAREVIKAFSKKGDTVIDCFNGGGTATIESISLGRRVIGVDISTLATFIARTKATPISQQDCNAIQAWCYRISDQIPNGQTEGGRLPKMDRMHYERHVPDGARCGIICSSLSA